MKNTRVYCTGYLEGSADRMRNTSRAAPPQPSKPSPALPAIISAGTHLQIGRDARPRTVVVEFCHVRRRVIQLCVLYDRCVATREILGKVRGTTSDIEQLLLVLDFTRASFPRRISARYGLRRTVLAASAPALWFRFIGVHVKSITTMIKLTQGHVNALWAHA